MNINNKNSDEFEILRKINNLEKPNQRDLAYELGFSLGKLNYNPATTLEFPNELEKQGFEIAPLSWQVMCRASKLPWHHRDPFDRYLIAEAQNRNAPILSTDEQLDVYEVQRIQ